MKADRDRETLARLETLIEETTADAADDDEKLWAFRQALEDHIAMPCDASEPRLPPRPDEAVRHCEGGLRISELSLGKQFDSVLLMGHVDNRPFLRCLHGYGLCCWRLERFEEAERTFDRMLWLNPSDNQGARFLIGAVRTRMPWTADPSRDVKVWAVISEQHAHALTVPRQQCSSSAMLKAIQADAGQEVWTS